MTTDLKSSASPSRASGAADTASVGSQTSERMRLADTPLFPEVGVVAVLPYRWSHLWMTCNHVLTRLARYFHVTWVNPPHGWSDPFLNRQNLHVPAHDFGPGFHVYQAPAWLPALYRPAWAADWASRKRLEQARQQLTRLGCRRIILYLWRPEFASALDHIPYDLSCYHIDDEYSFSTVDLPNSNHEARLIARVGQVFISSPALLEKKGKINPHTAQAPNGVDFQAHAQPIREPADIAGIPHPRIGYSGHLKKQLDWPLLLELTSRHSKWSWVFVGAPNRHPEMAGYLNELGRRANVHFLGAKTVQELATYAQHFDVCVMPYRLDDYTKYVSPLKLHEYLAGGRPVVGAAIESLRPFQDVVRLPETVDQWSAEIADALGPEANSQQQRAQRQARAREYDWEIIVRRIAETLVSRLDLEASKRK